MSRLEHSAATLQRNAITIRRCGRCCCNILPVLFAAPTDPPCCRFSSAYQRMLRYTARASSDVFLCSQPANSRMCPHQEQPRTIDRSQRAASSRQCAPSCPSLNVGASRTPHGNWCPRSVHDREVDPQFMFFSDEAWFSLHGELNFQNTRYWNAENPGLTHEYPPHDEIFVWCTMSARRVIGPSSYHGTVNAVCHVNNNLRPFSRI